MISPLFAKELKSYVSIMPKAYRTIAINIDDPIGEFKTNTKLLEVYDKKGNRIGFIREVTTSTGCNDGCLPVIFTLYYTKNGKFKRLTSKEGLTKKNHEAFTEFDYIRLESILRENPKVFKQVVHPSNMVDSISRATLKTYEPHVIKKAAYSTLRVNLYNQHTLKLLDKKYFSLRN